MKATANPKAGQGRRVGRSILVVLAVPLGIVAIYFIAVLTLSRIPVNADFQSVPGGIPVIVVDNGIHVDLILPVVAGGFDWRTIFAPAATRIGPELGTVATHIGIGWGHRDFYLNTPTWADMTATTVMRAILGLGGTVMHASYGPAWFEPDSSVFVYLPEADYRHLVKGIVATTVLDAKGGAVPLEAPGYGDNDAFFEAKGRYNALYTCNNWAASVLSAAGVRTPLWGPFSDGVMNQIRRATSG